MLSALRDRTQSLPVLQHARRGEGLRHVLYPGRNRKSEPNRPVPLRVAFVQTHCHGTDSRGYRGLAALECQSAAAIAGKQ